MKILFLIAALFVFGVNAFGPQASPWTKMAWLVGEWKGEGSGGFTFKPDLDGKVLLRKAHSEYPATADKPAVIHDDLMIVYFDPSGNPSKAAYFDNEGHTINYSISFAEKRVMFLSDKAANVPVFRLTYTMLDSETVNVKFEISQDGEKFMTYVEGKCKKTK